ncbi:MAG: class I SAM-dependent methyltransferase [Chloroflexota bacterium]|nr:class I SAM-dependent methyltransferase [Chloroflexota bacterium]
MAKTWAVEFIEDRITTPLHKKHLNYYAHRQVPVLEGVAQATGLHPSNVKKHMETLPGFLLSETKNLKMNTKWSATSELATTAYTLIKIFKPDVVVETGVGAGVSSWTILHALEENGTGKLISIDLPTPNTQLLPEVGYLVPTELRHRWDLRMGSSQELLPKVLNELGTIDIFHHDSRHSYSNQLREYESAWPFIKSGGILVSDDVSNDALHDATRLWQREPSIIGQNKESPIGLVRKL